MFPLMTESLNYWFIRRFRSVADNKGAWFSFWDHYKHNSLKSSLLITYLCIACGFEVCPRWEVLHCDGCFVWQHRTCGTGLSRVAAQNAVQNGAIDSVCVSWSVSKDGDFDLKFWLKTPALRGLSMSWKQITLLHPSPRFKIFVFYFCTC